MPDRIQDEARRIGQVYRRRHLQYDPLEPYILARRQEVERGVARILRKELARPVEEARFLDVGAGEGGNVLMFLKLGAVPSHITANELLPERAALLARKVPSSVQIVQGNALEVEFSTGPFDVVLQSLVFSSILDEEMQAHLARRIWDVVAPGGGLIWYDFTYDNPSNPDVRGVPLSTIRKLFPSARISHRRVTLAPPIARRAAGLPSLVHDVLHSIPFLRTHVLCWLSKE